MSKPGFVIRVGNIPPNTKNEEIEKVFSQFGEIIELKRPTNLAKHIPSPFAFIKYSDEHSAWQAMEEYDGVYVWDNRLNVREANKQQSYFTQDTGFITNEEFDVPRLPPPDFDSSLPATHYDLKRKQTLRDQTEVYSVRIDDLHPEITKEMLEEIFSQFGEIANVYLPVDLYHGCKPLGFAFIRYLSPRNAKLAAESMNGVNLGIGRNIVVQVVEQKRYFSQDESITTIKKR